MAAKVKDIGIGLMGLGVIGSGVAKVLLGKADALANQAGSRVVLKKILEKDLTKHGVLGIERSIFTTDFTEIVNHPEIDIVIELIGGENPAFEYIKRVILAGKHVVTANKEVMAKHGYELLTLAQDKGVALRFEASVGGGIPLIAPFQEDLIANDISAVYGIVNGTTNYILTRMTQEGLDFAVALKQAQELGYAERDPTNDIEGLDAAYKITILASLAFRTKVKPEDVYREGISRLEARDFRYARELGYAIKLLAIAKKSNRAVEVRVHPVFIPDDFLLAKVNGVYNGIQVEGDLVGKVIFYGQGAGPSPTSSAITADVVAIAQRISYGISNIQKLTFGAVKNIKPMSEVETRYYFRMNVADQPGVLAQISRILGNHHISISSVIQKESDPATQAAEIVIMTHPAKEKGVQEALKEMARLPVVRKINNLIRVEA